jgi:hypothetical protein
MVTAVLSFCGVAAVQRVLFVDLVDNFYLLKQAGIVSSMENDIYMAVLRH